VVGIAVGFAAKDTLANLFAGFFIIADAPYRVGDYVVLDTGGRSTTSAPSCNLIVVAGTTLGASV
jgi:small-conductance mechanosensitive channel